MKPFLYQYLNKVKHPKELFSVQSVKISIGISQSSSIKKMKHPECCVLFIVSIFYVKFNKVH